MQLLRHPAQGYWPLFFFAFGGFALGGVAWLWSNYGLDVFLMQAANFAMTCF